MKRSSILFLFALLPLWIGAQQDTHIARNTLPLSSVERIIMPDLDNQALIEAEQHRRSPGIAPRFAESMEVDIDPWQYGLWESIPGDRVVWRLRIFSKGARSLNLGFTKYFLPTGGSLILYSPDYSRILGPFTPADNEEHEQLWTPVLEGDELVIEIQLPAPSMEELQLQLGWVNHDFLGLGDLLSGACHLDVVCDADDGWSIVDDYRELIQSIALIGLNGNTFCTGFLVNNTREDCTPYLMTAFHCGFNSANAPSLIAYWNYQNSFCRQPGSPQSGQPGDGQLTDFNTGSIYRAGYQTSDFTLLELDDPVSSTADAFFAGWSRETVPPGSAVCIHHPNSEEKRISFENDPTIFTLGFSNTPSPVFDHVRVGNWDVGSTEPGSSGSPLFDQNKRIVGQLDAGVAECGNEASDWFGAFATSWEGGGSPSNRLKDWLDPDNLDVSTLNGKTDQACQLFVQLAVTDQDVCVPDDALYSVSVSDSFSGPVSLELTDLPAGATAVFTINPVEPGGSSTLTIGNTGGITPGLYPMTLTGSNLPETAGSQFSLLVVDAPPGNTTLLSPPDLATGVDTETGFSWTALASASTYELMIALDPGFNVVVGTLPNLTSNTFSGISLNVNTTYHWRVRPKNACGEGPWSTSASFGTNSISCLNEVSPNVPVPIPPGGTPIVSSTLEVATSGTIVDVNVRNLKGTHSYISDLTFALTSPQGTVVELIVGQCASEQNFDLNLDDEGEPTLPCPFTDGGTYLPAEPLANFNGEDPQGTWTLGIFDSENQDGGSLDHWELEICSETISFFSVSPLWQEVCENEDAQFMLDLSEEFAGPVTLTANGNPLGSNVDISPNPVAPGGVSILTVSNLEGLAGGYSLNIQASDGQNAGQTNVALNILPAPEATSLLQPVNNATNVSVVPVFSWAANADAFDYRLEIATDPGFLNIIETVQTSSTSADYPGMLDGETPYYWRVVTNTSCGEIISEAFSFTTEKGDAVEEIGGAEIAIYPSPTSGPLHLLLTSPLDEELSLQLFSIDGRKLLEETLPAGQLSRHLDLAGWASGLYLIRLQTSREVLSCRIVLD